MPAQAPAAAPYQPGWLHASVAPDHSGGFRFASVCVPLDGRHGERTARYYLARVHMGWLRGGWGGVDASVVLVRTESCGEEKRGAGDHTKIIHGTHVKGGLA